MIVTVFRSRLKPSVEAEYEQWGERMAALAEAMPGFVSAKDYVAADGGRVAIIEFESEATLRARSRHPLHLEAQAKGRRMRNTAFGCAACSATVRSRANGRKPRELVLHSSHHCFSLPP